MGMKKLTKAEARNLITPVVDDEVSAEERKAFMDYIEKHDDIRREYESIKRIKSLLCTRCPSAKAPDSLKGYVKSLSQKKSLQEEEDIPIYDIPCDGSVSQQGKANHVTQKRPIMNRPVLFSIAATVLILTTAWGFFSFQESTVETTIYNVEEYAYEHFMKYGGQFVPPTISTASMGSAETRLAQDYNMPMRVPVIRNAEFKGVIYREFVPDYEAPMLEYYLPSEDQFIYIFAFKLDKLEKFGKLVRHSEAIKACNKPKDFYITKVDGKHVVSWKWDDVWYAAISNHSGDTLASLVQPLEYSLADE